MYGARHGGGAGPIVLVPGGLFWTRRRAGVGFGWVVPDIHDYFLRRPKAGRLHPSSKSGPDMIISCGDLGLVGSNRHRKVVQNPHSRGLAPRLRVVVFQRLHKNPHHIWCCARSGWWPCGSMGWCYKKLHQNSYPVWAMLAGWCSRCCANEVVFQKLEWCSIKLSQNPHSVYYLSYSFM